MYRIVEKTPLNPTVTKMVVEAPLIAKKALPGQFVILRAGPTPSASPSPWQTMTGKRAPSPSSSRWWAPAPWNSTP